MHDTDARVCDSFAGIFIAEEIRGFYQFRLVSIFHGTVWSWEATSSGSAGATVGLDGGGDGFDDPDTSPAPSSLQSDWGPSIMRTSLGARS